MRLIFTMIIPLLLALFIREGIALETAPDIGKLAPVFELSNVDGQKISLSTYKGKVILLNFWATHCPPCKAEMPSLNNLFLAFKDEGFVVLAISIDSSEKRVHEFLKKNPTDFPMLLDKEQEVYFDEYGVLGLPTSVLIDRAGIIREIIRGERVWDSPVMKEKILKILTNNEKEGK